jgi:hypothetical protein
MSRLFTNVPLEKDREYFPKKDRDISRQQAFVRYLQLKRIKESERSVEDNLFIENFEAAMHYMWGL